MSETTGWRPISWTIMVTTVKIMVNLKIYALYGKGESMKPFMDLEQKSSVAGLEWGENGVGAVDQNLV